MGQNGAAKFNHMARVPFIKKEDDFILNNYHDTSVCDIAKILGRRHSSIVSRFRYLGLPTPPAKFYTEEDEKLLMDPSYSTRQLAKMLNRSRDSIADKRSRMGFKYPKRNASVQKVELSKRPPAIYDNKGYLYLMEKYGQAI